MALDKDNSDDVAGEDDLVRHHKSSAEVAAKAAKATAARVRALEERDARGGGNAVAADNARDLTAGFSMDALRGKLPTSNSTMHITRRAEMFNSMDSNANGSLSLREVESGLRLLFGRDAKAVKGLSPAISHAFAAAKDAKKGKPGALDASDTVSKSEFRLLLVALKRYTELLQLFDNIDTDDDRSVDLSEFRQSLPLLRQWGVGIPDPPLEFSKIDHDGSGKLKFGEFAHWALLKGLDNDARDNVPGEDDVLVLHQKASPRRGRHLRKTAAGGGAAGGAAVQPNRRWQGEPDLPRMILALPCEKTERDALARRELFEEFCDPDGVQYLYEDEVCARARARARACVRECVRVVPVCARCHDPYTLSMCSRCTLTTRAYGCCAYAVRTLCVCCAYAVRMWQVEAGLRSALGPLSQARHAGVAATYIVPSVRKAFRAVTEQRDVVNVGVRDFRLLFLYFKWHFFEMFGQPSAFCRTPNANPRSGRPTDTDAPSLTPHSLATPLRFIHSVITAPVKTISPRRYSPEPSPRAVGADAAHHQVKQAAAGHGGGGAGDVKLPQISPRFTPRK